MDVVDVATKAAVISIEKNVTKTPGWDVSLIQMVVCGRARSEGSAKEHLSSCIGWVNEAIASGLQQSPALLRRRPHLHRRLRVRRRLLHQNSVGRTDEGCVLPKHSGRRDVVAWPWDRVGQKEDDTRASSRAGVTIRALV